MARRIPDETLQAIRDRISIVEVVSAYVSLKRAGRNAVGLCPFHSEKTPSFTVSDERGLYHCFGCGESGTVFTFVMKMERLEFLDAVAQLAKRAGVALPERGSDDPVMQRREQLYDANARAERFFQETLASAAGAPARRYLSERGLRQDTIARYGLGFAPATGTALATRLTAERVPPDLAVQAGLLARHESGRIYDRFRGRVVFPIRDRRGRPIAFGGRTLGTDQPKYLNSPETPLFRKGEGLYGVAEARDAIRAADRAVLVEGYMDALLLAQEGVPYTVATLGTALTAAQLHLIKRFGGDALAVFFFFDGDRAGRQAALRAFGVCAEAGVWGRAAFLPEGFDPDSYTRRHGGAATRALLDAAPSLVDFYFDALLPSGATLPQRTRVADEVKRLLARVADDVQFELLARHAAARLGLSEETFRRARSAAPAAPAPRPTPAKPSAAWPATELMLVKLMAVEPEVARAVLAGGTLARFKAADLAQAGEQIGAAWAQGRPVGELLDQWTEPLKNSIAAALLGEGPIAETDDRSGTAAGLVQRIEQDAARAERQHVHSALRHAQTFGDEAVEREQLAILKDELRRKEGGAG